MKNLKTHAVTLVIYAATALLSLTPSAIQAEPKALNSVAIIVNNAVVLESEVVEMMNSVKQNANRANQQLPDDTTLHNQVIERLIVDSLIQQLGQNAGIQIGNKEIDQAIEGITQQNNININQLQESLAADGISFEHYRQQIRKDIILNEVRNNEVRRRINILPQEVESLSKQIAEQADNQTELNISHILIKLPSDPSQEQVDQAQQRSQALVTQLNNGADFGKLAATYSADAQALQGGNMGWSSVEELPSIFANAVNQEPKHSIIGPIRSGVGFHILRINDIRNKQAATITNTEFQTRHILLKPSVLLNDDQIVAKLQQFREQIISKKIPFEQLAKEYSADPGSAAQGGDLGWSIADIYDPSFRQSILELEKGQISEPVRSSFGWHLIQVLDTRQIDGTKNALKQQAHRLLFNRKFAEEMQNWMQELRATAYVKIVEGVEP